jgi:uncharacterized membrane protein
VSVKYAIRVTWVILQAVILALMTAGIVAGMVMFRGMNQHG